MVSCVFWSKLLLLSLCCNIRRNKYQNDKVIIELVTIFSHNPLRNKIKKQIILSLKGININFTTPDARIYLHRNTIYTCYDAMRRCLNEESRSIKKSSRFEWFLNAEYWWWLGAQNMWENFLFSSKTIHCLCSIDIYNFLNENIILILEKFFNYIMKFILNYVN